MHFGCQFLDEPNYAKKEIVLIAGTGGRTRTDTGFPPLRILSPVRLPISPPRHGI